MSYEEYWHGPFWLVNSYYEAEQMRQDRLNETAWLNGIYITHAIRSTIGNAFSKQKSEYPEKPIGLHEREKTQVEIEMEEDKELKTAKAYMNAIVNAGKNWEKDG